VGVYVIMGVAGCGKSTVGAALAAELGAVYLDGDDLHSAANITKMSAGEPLSDADRAPWLRGIGQALAAADGMLIVGCSALRRIYRDWIREQAKSDVVFLHLSGSRAVIERRMSAREGHFMPVQLLDSQFATLEPLQVDETAFVVDIDQELETVVAKLADYIRI
jgi:gluconokinase